MGKKNKKKRELPAKDREPRISVSSAKGAADAAYERGKKIENARIREKLEERICYYAETIGVMENLDCEDGAKTAKIAMEALRWFDILAMTETTITPELMREMASDD